MKIAIIGTRGIPNNYGGFEQLAQYLSLGLIEKGHEVYVYNSDKHDYKDKIWKGVNIIHKQDPEKYIGAIGQFIYDLNCIINARKHNFDVILNLGYTSSSIWMRLFPKKSRVITNMDGLEWKRSKYSKNVQKYLMYAENLAVKHSDFLVADSKAIQVYLLQKYKVQSAFIAYGAKLFNKPDTEKLLPFAVEAYKYNMLIARMEPENNIETILDGVSRSKNNVPFLVIGNSKNKFGLYLIQKFKDDKRIIFSGSIYDESLVDNLRYFSNLYFHGHSVGGTNPSLLEAMGCKSLIMAHDNEFNKSVLGNSAYYFKDSNEISDMLDVDIDYETRKKFTDSNIIKIESDYSWGKIIELYEKVMLG